MKKSKIRDSFRFSLALAFAVVSIGMLVMRNIGQFLIFLFGALTCFLTSFSEDSVVKRVENNIEDHAVDERDYFIALQAKRRTLEIILFLLISGSILFCLLGVKFPSLLLLSDACIVFYFLILLVNHITNLYYEKHC